MATVMPPTDVSVATSSPEETLALGKKLGQALQRGDVLAMVGDLGAGKTVLTKGIAAGLGADPNAVTSPTFVLMTRHQARLPLHHFDAYRLSGAEEMIDIGAEETFYGEGVSVVEWADRVAEALPEDHLMIVLRVSGESERQIRFVPKGPRSAVLAAICSSLR